MFKVARAWQLLSAIIAVVLLVEGLLVVSVAAPATIEGNGTISAGDLQLFGLLLLVVGAVGLALGVLAFVKPQLLEEGSRLSITSKLVKVIGGMAIAIEGIVLALMAGRTVIEGQGTYEAYIVAAFVAQVFFLGVALLLLELIGDVEFRLGRMLMYLGGLVAASEGVAIIGIADETIIEGLGGILERTVLYAGAQLLIIGLLFLFCCLMVDRFGKGKGLFSVLRLVSGALIVIEGLAVIAMATAVTPAHIGTITSRTLVIAGVQLALFGGMALLMVSGRAITPSRTWAKVSGMTAIALLLLIPAALLTVGRFW